MAPEAAPSLERLLIAMGFRHAGQHRSKAVQLWRHGDTRILVNHEPPAPDSPRVAAIAVESADPIGSARRAEALLAPVLPRDRGPGEADLSAIAAPDGTSVFFCRTDAPPTAGSPTSSPPAPPAPGAELIGIDHVALSQPFDYFDEAALFYRSVLGLALEDGAELAAPDGLVRSRAARSADGSVRFALSVPSSAAAAAELQHVAFACDDVFARARAMRERGVPLLEIPGNYYDDLAARTELDPEAIERMRELGVLYARSDGELLHFYTAMAGRLFFEVVERRGGSEGYGAANSPVRMAAQRGG